MNGLRNILCCVLVPVLGWSQGEVGLLFEEMPNDSLTELSLTNHTSLKPLIRRPSSNRKSENYVKVAALGDLNYFQQRSGGYKLGLGAEVKGLLNNKWFFRLAAVEGISQTDTSYFPKTYLRDSLSSQLLYTDLRGRISYTPNHIFNLQAGLDHQFIGEGARSLLLSDYGTSYPFGQIRMRFWRIEYSILYQFLRERDNQRWEGKFASSHHISLNVTKWLNIGIFESVIFQPKDTLLNRGFDVEYLNPFVFYRPQEYSLGSSDNVLMGLELSAKWKGHTFYSQFILDEFYLAEIRARSGWWASKYGGQLGIKGRLNINGQKFFYRAEYNFVRPYTYAHLSEELNYGNQGSPLAHPYGSNFMEGLIELKWAHNKWFTKVFANYYMRAHDQNSLNYGNDIYVPYINRPYEYGHYIGQGQKYNGTKTMLSVGYQLLKHGQLHVFMENHLDYTTLNPQIRYSFVFGVRSLLWNDYRNY